MTYTEVLFDSEYVAPSDAWLVDDIVLFANLVVLVPAFGSKLAAAEP